MCFRDRDGRIIWSQTGCKEQARGIVSRLWTKKREHLSSYTGRVTLEEVNQQSGRFSSLFKWVWANVKVVLTWGHSVFSGCINMHRTLSSHLLSAPWNKQCNLKGVWFQQGNAEAKSAVTSNLVRCALQNVSQSYSQGQNGNMVLLTLFWDAVSVSRSTDVTWPTLQENKGNKKP